MVEAAHPIPDAAGRNAAGRILDLVAGLGQEDLLLCLISGGGSALLSLPAPGITLDDKQALSKALLKSGANINEINSVRKHLSAIKGGRLAVAAAPARIVSLVISDVPGDDPSVIASGPTTPMRRPSPTPKPCAASRHHPAAVRADPLDDSRSETPKPGDSAFARSETRIIAAPQASLEAAANVASLGRLSRPHPRRCDRGRGERGGEGDGGNCPPGRRVWPTGATPMCPDLRGETTVTVRGAGRGGRNVEFLLSMAVELDGRPRIFAIAGDTDGVDGAEEIAGALLTPDSLERARRART